MNRRNFIQLGVAAAAFPSSLVAQTEKRRKIYMITWRGNTEVEKGFQNYLTGKNLPVEFVLRDAGQDVKRIAEFIDEIRQVKPDLVYTWGTSATLAVVGPWDKPSNRIGDIPLVFTLVASAAGAKLVPSVPERGRNITGVSHMAPLETQIAAMRSYRAFRRVGVLYNAAEQNSVAGIKELQALSKKQGFDVVPRTFRADPAGKPVPEGIAGLVSEIRDAGAEWLYIGPDSYLFTRLQDVADAANQMKLPTFATTEAVVNSSAGVLAGLVSKYYSIGEFTGFKAEQILFKGIPATRVPVETLSRFSFQIRMETAKRINFFPPVSLFNYAEFL